VIAAHLAALEGALPGPARTKRALLDEARDGLDDAAAAYRDAGLDPAEAQRRAVEDFGEVAALAPAFAHEIGLAQARRTARVLCVALPLLFLAAHGLLAVGPTGPPPSRALLVLAEHLAGLATLTVLLSASALALGGRIGDRSTRWGRRMPRMVGAVALVGGLATAGGVAAMLVDLPLDEPGPAALGLATLLAATVTSWSGLTCRRTGAPPRAG
jgi:hypothetical protein